MTSENIHKFLSDLVVWFNTLPGHWFYAAGVLIASIGLTPVIVEAVKRRHLAKNGQEMTNHMIDFVITVTGFGMAVADFLIVNGTNTAYLLPQLAAYITAIKAFAPTVYNLSKALHNWFINRKGESQQERLKAVLNVAEQAVDSKPSSLFPEPVSPKVPPQNVFDL